MSSTESIRKLQQAQEKLKLLLADRPAAGPDLARASVGSGFQAWAAMSRSSRAMAAWMRVDAAWRQVGLVPAPASLGGRSGNEVRRHVYSILAHEKPLPLRGLQRRAGLKKASRGEKCWVVCCLPTCFRQCPAGGSFREASLCFLIFL